MADPEVESSTTDPMAWFDDTLAPGEWINETWIGRLGGSEMRVLDVAAGAGRHRLLCRVKPSDDEVWRWNDLDYQGLQEHLDEIKAIARNRNMILWPFAGPMTAMPAHLVPPEGSLPATYPDDAPGATLEPTDRARSSVRQPNLEEWLAEVEYLAAHPAAGPSHEHPGCAWQPYREFYAVNDMVTEGRHTMFHDLTYTLATSSKVEDRAVRDHILTAFASHFGTWDTPDGSGPDPFVESLTEVRAIRDLLVTGSR